MMKHNHNFVALSALFALLNVATTPSPASADDSKTAWYKGNLHTHSLWSDGNDFPEVICKWYKDKGYHFVALSDHNILAKGVKWMNVRDINRRGGPLALGRYKEQYGEEWVITRKNDAGHTLVRLRTLAEYRPKLEEPGKFILVQGEEITDSFGGLPVHMNATNLAELIKPQRGKSVRDVMRRNLAAAEAQAERLGIPIVVHLNHPNFKWGVTAEDLAHVVEERFFEVYNGHPGVAHRGDATHPSVERLWDIANTIRIDKLKAHPLFGLATDDSHNYFGTRGSSPGRGWVMVRATKLDANTVTRAIQRGDFYASSGVTLNDVQYDPKTRELTVHIKPDGDATYTTQFVGTLKSYDKTTKTVVDKSVTPRRVTHTYSTDVGRVLKTAKGNTATYKLTGNELYVRAVITSSKGADNPVWQGQKRQAWTQPVGWEMQVK